jgi:predicted XRE-type DNA-binding protein
MMNEIAVVVSNGNVFADLGLPDAGELLAKADLAIEIGRLLDERGLSQVEAAKLLRTSTPRISDLRRGDLQGFTIDRLFRFLNTLGQEVEISVYPSRKTQARVVVHVHAA